MQQVKAVIARAKGEPVELVTINVPSPGPGEAVVKVASCGVATPTSTPARARSTTTSRSSSATPDLDCVFTGDTLFDGGPGATGRSYSDLPTLEKSIRTKLFALPAHTTVHTGHGNSTTIGKERAQVAAEEIPRRVRMMRLPGEECVP